MPVYKEGKQVGRVTSITWGPTIKKMIGFGSVDKRFEEIGTRLSVEWSVEGERGKVAATVVPDAVPRPRTQAYVTRSGRGYERPITVLVRRTAELASGAKPSAPTLSTMA